VPLHDPADGREPDPGAFERGSGVGQPFELAEQLIGVGEVEPDAVVTDGDDDLVPILLAADADLGDRSWPGELERVGG
jgi:hypothetical protein